LRISPFRINVVIALMAFSGLRRESIGNNGGSDGLMLKESPNPIPELAEEFEVSENFMRKRFLF